MKKTPAKPEIGRIVRDRLLRVARDRGEDYQRVISAYVNERFLYRLASSDHSRRFILKGASLFVIWTGRTHRATRDVDLLGLGTFDEQSMRQTFSEILACRVVDDGVTFDMETMVISPIREEQRYGGIRVEVMAKITTVKVRLQIDIGVGDVVTPDVVRVEFPTMLDFPVPHLNAYPRCTVVAEKLEAIVQLGMANSRMKDFYDIMILARISDFTGDELCRAIRATFVRRNTALPNTIPVAFTSEFSNDRLKQTQWSGFVRKSGTSETSTLEEAVSAVADFVLKPLSAVASGISVSENWKAPGPWK